MDVIICSDGHFKSRVFLGCHTRFSFKIPLAKKVEFFLSYRNAGLKRGGRGRERGRGRRQGEGGRGRGQGEGGRGRRAK